MSPVRQLGLMDILATPESMGTTVAGEFSSVQFKDLFRQIGRGDDAAAVTFGDSDPCRDSGDTVHK